MYKVAIVFVVIAGLGLWASTWLEEPGIGAEQAVEQMGVTVRGDLEEVYPSGAFRFDPEEGWINYDSILVVPAEGVMAPEGASEVEVEGEVEEIDDVDFPERFGFEVDALRDDLDHSLFIIAERVDPIDAR